MLKSTRNQLLFLIILAVLPPTMILVYSNYERQQQDLNTARKDALMMVQALANDHENVVKVTQSFLATLARLPALQNRDAAACGKLFKELLKDNTQYATIYATDSEGWMFANALPFGRVNLSQRKYFQEVMTTKAFSAGDYTIGQVSKRTVLPFAYPVVDAKGRVTGVVAVSLDLEKYRRTFESVKQFPEGATLNLLDRNFVRLLRYPDHEKYVGKVDLPGIVKKISEGPEEGVFSDIGVDGVKRLIAYKKILLQNQSSPYLYMRVGVPEAQALAVTKKTFFRNMALSILFLLATVSAAWLMGHVLIVKKLRRTVDAAERLRQGDLSARTDVKDTRGDLGRLARSFDEMAEALQAKELERRRVMKELRDSEIKFKTFAEQAIVGTYLLQYGVFKYVNPRFSQMFGYTVEECLANMSLESLVHPEDLPFVKEQVRRRIAGEVDVVHYTFRGLRKGGEVIDVEIFGSTGVFDGRVAAAGTVLDITERKVAEEKIRESEAALRLLMETLPVGLIVVDPVTRVIEQTNQSAAAMFGAPENQIVGRRCHAFLCPASEGACPICDLGNEIDNSEREMIRANGQRLPVLKSVKRIRIQGREKLLECFVDITPLKKMEEALRVSEERFRQLSEVFPETIFEADAQGNITYANKHGLEQFGYDQNDLTQGLNILNLVAPSEREKVMLRVKEKLQGIDRGYLDYLALRKDGSTFYAMGYTTVMKVNGVPSGVRGFILDITKRREAEERIRYMATHDALTALPSLRLAKDRMTLALNRARREKSAVAILFIDLDGFKDVNDTMGHEAGDHVLKEVARRMRGCVRETDTIARIGGDEFLMILGEIHSSENAALIAEKVIGQISQPILLNGQQAVVSASIGIALYPKDGEDLEKLIKEADIAMYKIKKTGKNGYCFS